MFMFNIYLKALFGGSKYDNNLINLCRLKPSMGNPSSVCFALDTSEFSEPAELKKVYTAELKRLLIVPPDLVLPLYRDGNIVSHALIHSYTKRSNGTTIVHYESAPEPETLLKEIPLEFNWIIKVGSDTFSEGGVLLETRLHVPPPSQYHGEHQTIYFEKPKNPHYRDFPVGVPIELWRNPHPDENGIKAVPLAKVNILELTVGNGVSKGYAEVLKPFSQKEKEMMSRNFM